MSNVTDLRKQEPVYIQFSKRMTKWALVQCVVTFLFCVLSVVFFPMDQHSTSALVTLYTTFCTVLGVIVGGYHGNSTLEKYQRLKGTITAAVNENPVTVASESNG